MVTIPTKGSCIQKKQDKDEEQQQTIKYRQREQCIHNWLVAEQSTGGNSQIQANTIKTETLTKKGNKKHKVKPKHSSSEI